MRLSEMGTGAGLCVWLATDEKLGDPPPLKQLLLYLALCPSPPLARCWFPVFGIILSCSEVKT